MKKRGIAPEGLNVSILIILIALFIIAYVILLPPEEREKLLEIEEVGEGWVKTLLSESPGLIGPLEEETIRHQLAPIDLFLRTEPDISYLVSSLYLERGLFTSKFHELTFGLDQLNNLRKMDLYFFVRDSKGILRVKLNGEEIYANRIRAGKMMSINLPLRLLKDINYIELSVSFALFGRNSYSLEDMKLRGEYHTANTKEERYFVIPSYEHNYLKSAKLNYFIRCNAFSEEGVRLKIELNNKPFRDMTIPCTSRESSFDILINNLKEGKNSLNFEIDEGDYSFRDIEVELELKEKIYPTYYFVINERDYESLIDGDSVAVLDLTFADIDKLKEAQFFINGKRVYLSTRDDTYSKDISDYLKEGSNRLKVIPKNRFDIVSLEINLKEV